MKGFNLSRRRQYDNDERRRQGSSRRWDGDSSYDREDDYHRTAKHFYDTPSQNSAVVETVFRKPKVFANLHEFDEVPEIDRVPTAIGYHSMDSADEIVEARSKASRYEMEEEREPEPEQAREDAEGDEPTTEDTQEEEEEELEAEESEDDGDRYAHHFADDIAHDAESNDSDSCPAMWRSFSEDHQERTHEWALAEAKRRQELNSVSTSRALLNEELFPQKSHDHASRVSTEDERSLSTRRTSKSKSNDEKSTSTGHASRKSQSRSLTEDEKSAGASRVSRKSQGRRSLPSRGDDKSTGTGINSKRSHGRKKVQATATSKKKSWGFRKLVASTRSPKSKATSTSIRSKPQQATEPKKRVTAHRNGGRATEASRKVSKRTTTNSGASRQSVEKRRPKARTVEAGASASSTAQTKSVASKSRTDSRSSKTKNQQSAQSIEEAHETNSKKSEGDNSSNVNDDLIKAVRDEEIVATETEPATEKEGTQGEGSEDAVSGFTNWVKSGFAHFADFGYKQPMLAMLDWSGEEKKIEELGDNGSVNDEEELSELQHDDNSTKESLDISLASLVSKPSEEVLKEVPAENRQLLKPTDDGSKAWPARGRSRDRSIKQAARHLSPSEELDAIVASREPNEELDAVVASREPDQVGEEAEFRQFEESGSKRSNGVSTISKSQGGSKKAAKRQSKQGKSDDSKSEVKSLHLDEGKTNIAAVAESSFAKRELKHLIETEEKSLTPSVQGLSISTIEFPTPGNEGLQSSYDTTDDDSISILGLSRSSKTKKSNSSSNPLEKPSGSLVKKRKSVLMRKFMGTKQ